MTLFALLCHNVISDVIKTSLQLDFWDVYSHDIVVKSGADKSQTNNKK